MGNCFSVTLSPSTDSAVSQCFQCTGKHASYVYAVEENLDALKTALEELTDAKNDLLRSVRVAEQQQHLVRLDKVQRWISRAEAMETEVNELMLRRHEEISKLCLWGCFSKNCVSTYKFGKEVSKMLDAVTSLQGQGDFDVVAEKKPTASVVEMPLDQTVGFESLIDKVWRDLCDEKVRVMGLYGMGGVGKTTLLKEVNNNLLSTDYTVIWMVVSKNHTPEKIQNLLGKKIGYESNSWKMSEWDQKAADIYSVLSKKKFVLLLDDIWERVDLTKLGVPSRDKLNGSKIVFTTRSKSVSSAMNTDIKVEVRCLAWDKSWELFQEMVGEELLGSHPDLLSLAKIVAKECGGLPLALITIGRAMSCKRTPEEWKHAIKVLKSSASEFSGMGDEVLPILKFSYDNLSSEKARSCFLYCVLFPEDWEIGSNELIDYWMAEGFVDGYNEGFDIIGLLIHSCLLEEATQSSSVQMHDVIRDMALWIASDCGNSKNSHLVQPNADLFNLPSLENCSEVSRISLMFNRIETLSGTPKFPNLLTLHLNDNKLRQISGSFFGFMPKLRVLNLSRNPGLTYLPGEISKLVALQHLDLSFTQIEELPQELTKLKMLRFLNLDHTENLDSLPRHLLSCFPLLQSLKVFGCGFTPEKLVEEHGIEYEANELLVQEINTLIALNSLDVTINSVSALKSLFASQKLRDCTQALLLDRLAIEEIKMEWCHEKRDSQATNYLQPPMFTSLHTIVIANCRSLKDLTCLVYVPELKYLHIQSCLALQEIISPGNQGDAAEATKHPEPFVELLVLYLENLPSLTSIYHKPLPFSYLQHLSVHSCALLKKLPITTTMGNLSTKGDLSWWNELQWDDEATRDSLFPLFEVWKSETY